MSTHSKLIATAVLLSIPTCAVLMVLVAGRAAEPEAEPASVVEVRGGIVYNSEQEPEYQGIKIRTLLSEKNAARLGSGGEVDVMISPFLLKDFEVYDAELFRKDGVTKAEVQPYYAAKKPEGVHARFLFTNISHGEDQQLNFILRSHSKKLSEEDLERALRASSQKDALRVTLAKSE